MARPKDRSKRTRDSNNISSQTLRSRLVTPDYLTLQVEDRRRWSPSIWDPPKGRRRDALQLMAVDPVRERQRQVVKDTLRFKKRLGPFAVKLFDEAPYVHPGVKWRVPKMVAICVRRKMRREVLHALHLKKGKGGAKRKQKFEKAKWNEFSLIRCR